MSSKNRLTPPLIGQRPNLDLTPINLRAGVQIAAAIDAHSLSEKLKLSLPGANEAEKNKILLQRTKDLPKL